MALTSVYYDGIVTETDRAQNRAGAADYGVYGPEDFKVTAHPSIPYAVLVKAGRAHGHGVTDTAAIDQVVQCATLATGTRWDLIAVRRNWQPALGGPSTLVSIPAGTLGQIPAGRKVGPGVEDDQPLFLVQWQGGVSAPVQFIDLRVWTGSGGLYAKDEGVLAYLSAVGTEVNVNGVHWSLQLGLNDIPAWVRQKNQAQADVTTVTTNSSGDATINFPVQFKSTLKGATLTDATSPSSLGAIILKLTYGTSSRTKITFRAYTTTGAPLANQNIAVSWSADGY